MAARKSTLCKRSVKNCGYCITGFHKRPARRKDRRTAKAALKNISPL